MADHRAWVCHTDAHSLSPLSLSLQLRHTAYDVTLWRTAANVFLRLAPLAATAVDATHPRPLAAGDAGDRLWGRLSDALSKFLLGPKIERGGTGGTGGGGGVTRLPEPAPRPATRPAQGAPDRPSHQDPSIPVIPFLGGSKKRTVGRLFSREPKDAPGDRAAAPDDDPNDDPDDPADVGHRVDEARAVEDAELELKVLDCLTDEILTSCASATQADIDALLCIIEEGISRPSKYQIPVSAKHSNFSMVCIRKMYVLCSRGTNEHEVRNHVAKCALPRFLRRCHDTICTFSEESQYTPLGDRHGDRPKLEELICILEVLATMTLSSDVVDSIMPRRADDGGGDVVDPMAEYVRLMRQRPDVARRGKERTHLLFLYDALCSLITCRESRIRDMVRDVMQLAGADLGFSLRL